MRKQQQKQILDIIETIYKANSEIESLFLRRELSAVLQLLEDCQDGVVQIGKFIEILEGEGTKTVALLEEYHESLYNFGEKLETIDAGFVKCLQNQLFRIENNIRSELSPDRIEVVFFPYKVSMWDSFESIWLAAKEDPKCDAYVVPIPYFDRLPNGKLGQMHYEGTLYPDDIPIVDWRTYDLEERRPDVIFIHNPYDEGNYVTSVHPDYYSGRLKSFTELLCYVPYFVSYGNVEEHFVLCSGVLNADRVFLQSEKVRDTYIRVFKEFEKKNRCSGCFGKAEIKFVSLGSPKFDRVLNTKRKDCNLPEGWRKLTEKKKVVFYNTSVGAFLQGSEQYLKKLCSVFDTFRSRKDVTLWWRPHPLMEATCQSMRPDLLTEYKKIVADYRRDGWGIYDDTPDFHRSIAISDALYGDFSSVGVLYSATGKPVLISNYDVDCSIDAETQQEYLHSDMVQFGQQLLLIDEFEHKYPEWFKYWLPYRNKGQTRFILQPDYEYGVSGFLNAIYTIDEENGRAKYYKSFPMEDYVPWSYNVPIRIGNRLLFTPIRSRGWAFYDLETDEWTYEPIPKDLYPSKDWSGAFGGWLLNGNDLLFFSGESGAIAKYSIDTRKITYHREWFLKLRDHIVNVDWGIICKGLHYNDSLLLFSPQTNLVVELNPQTMSVINTYRVGVDSHGFRTALLIPNTDTVYLIPFREPGKTPWTETIVKWNVKNGSVKELTNLPICFIENHTQNALNGFALFKGELYATPLQSDSILKINIKTDEITRLALTPELDFFKRKSGFYDWGKDYALPYVDINAKRMKYTVQLLYDYSLADLDIENGEISNRRKWYVEGIADIYKTQGKVINPNLPLVENQFLTLANFLAQLDSEELALISKEKLSICCDQPAHADGTAGRAIYDYVKRSGGI